LLSAGGGFDPGEAEGTFGLEFVLPAVENGEAVGGFTVTSGLSRVREGETSGIAEASKDIFPCK
jgi:hypothetical protein